MPSPSRDRAAVCRRPRWRLHRKHLHEPERQGLQLQAALLALRPPPPHQGKSSPVGAPREGVRQQAGEGDRPSLLRRPPSPHPPDHLQILLRHAGPGHQGLQRRPLQGRPRPPPPPHQGKSSPSGAPWEAVQPRRAPQLRRDLHLPRDEDPRLQQM
eukprot:7874489-Pyramimonas_sp.AAC.1